MTLWSFVPDLIRRQLSGRPGSQRLLDEPQFRRALERERLRADRLHRSFSFLEFQLAPATNYLLEPLATLLEKRLRLTDEFGRHGAGIGVILPETPLAAASLLGEEISRAAGEAALPWRACQYPETHAAPEPAELTLAELESALAADEAGETDRSAQLLFVKRLPLWKRTIDVLAAGCGRLLAAPILAAAALAIRLTSPGPVLFLQRRTGLGGRPFTIYKLRTMRLDAEQRKAELRALSEQDGPAFKLKHDPRVTTVGKYLRKTCLDELPQLWNVLRGDMTLVGPRPLPCDEADGCEAWQRRRLDVTPGLTCIWQVNSGRSRVAFADWMRMDLRYIRGRSLCADLKLLWKTIVAVILHRASH